MTCKLSSHNRWCITGTPVERDLRGNLKLFYIIIVKAFA